MDFGKTAADAATGALGGITLGPLGMIAGALMSAVPDLINTFAPHLASAQGEQIAQAVVSAVSAVTGAPSPTPADITALTPDAKANLQVQLAQIAAGAEVARLNAAHAAETTALAEIEARVADTSSARAMTVGLAQSHSPLAWGAALISAIILVAFGGTTYVVLVYALPPGPSATLSNVLLGTLAAMATQVANYWLGSSSGSQSKDAAIANSVPASALSSMQAHAVSGAAPPFASRGTSR